MAENKMDMIIPDSWIEFEKHVGFYDDKKIYTNGVRLVPTNRVNQWLEYIDRKNKREKNKMEAVAQLFGKKLDEHFCVSYCKTRFLLKFTSDGLWVFDDSWGHWNGEGGMLEALLRGEAVIVDE